jgi:nitrate/nitrite transporter NarK
VLLPLAAAAPALAAFVGWETRTHAPMVPPQLFRDRTFATASLASVAMYSAAFGVLFLLTQLLQVGLGAAPLDAGLRTVPLAAMPVLLAPLGGLLCGRFGARPLMIVALSLETVAFAWLALAARPDVTYPVLLPALLMMGAGLPLFWSPIASVSLGAARPQEQGQASGASTAIRELAIVLGVAALAATFTARGGDSSPTGVLPGFPPAAWLAAGLAAAGLIATIAMPARRSSPAAADPRPVAEAAAA